MDKCYGARVIYTGTQVGPSDGQPPAKDNGRNRDPRAVSSAMLEVTPKAVIFLDLVLVKLMLDVWGEEHRAVLPLHPNLH